MYKHCCETKTIKMEISCFKGTKYAEHAVYDDDWPILCDYWGSPDQGHRAGGRTQGGHPRGQAHFLFVFKIFFDRIKYLYFSQ